MRLGVVLARLGNARADNVPPAAKFELAERRKEERIIGKAIAGGDRAESLRARARTLKMRVRYGAVERGDRGRPSRHQPVVEVNNVFRVGVLRVLRDGSDQKLVGVPLA